jgi:hypothetical protein
MRDEWTDPRLDDLTHRVDAGFTEMNAEFRAVRGELGAQMAALHRTMLQLFGGMIVAMVLGFGGLITTILMRT